MKDYTVTITDIPELLRCLEAAQEVIHLAHCKTGDAGGNTECWKECREATAIIKKTGESPDAT